MQRKPLIGIDFDGTIANTFAPSPNKVDVTQASEMAIRKVLGENGIRVYHEYLHGLQNREPGELIRELMAIARDHNIPLAVGSTTSEIITAFVDTKISYLLNEISEKWPILYPGIKELFRAVQKGEIAVDLAIISSGHDAFIRKVFDTNGLETPAILLTSDYLRNSRDWEGRDRHKPSPHLLARTHLEWKRPHGFCYDQPNSFVDREKQDKPRMLYIGDDPIKDGSLAENGRIAFGFVPFTNPGYTPDKMRGQFLIASIDEFRCHLERDATLLERGGSFSDIFFDTSDNLIFPAVAERERPYMRGLSVPHIRGERMT